MILFKLKVIALHLSWNFSKIFTPEFHELRKGMYVLTSKTHPLVMYAERTKRLGDAVGHVSGYKSKSWIPVTARFLHACAQVAPNGRLVTAHDHIAHDTIAYPRLA